VINTIEQPTDGLNTFYWDYNSETGERVRAGVYLLSVMNGNQTVISEKVCLMP